MRNIKTYFSEIWTSYSFAFHWQYEDNQEHNTNTKRKTEGNLEKEFTKMRNDIKEIKRPLRTKIKTDQKQMRTQETAKKGKEKKQKIKSK